MPDNALILSRRPSRAVSIAVSAALVVLWVWVRLVVFDDTIFPLTYVLPLLVCVWTRDRIALWSMAAVFVAIHAAKMLWLLPAGMVAADDLQANLIATLLNILVGAIAIHIIIDLRTRLEGAVKEVRAQAEELRAQGEELAQQNEELAEQAEELSRQTEELSQQGEELASQNEELQSQAEEIGGLNSALERRERLLGTLLEAAQLARSEHAALQHIAVAALDLFGETGVIAAIYEKTAAGLQLHALATEPPSTYDDSALYDDALVRLVVEESRTAALNDVSLRPDLLLPAFPGARSIRSVLCAPVHVGNGTSGAFAIYGAACHEWSDEEFRLAGWLADQSGRALQALRVQSDLREADRRKSEFLATLSHELRNPLAPIRFALKLIEQDETKDSGAVEVIQRQFQQLVRLVDDLLDATRLSSNKIQVRKTRSNLVSIVQHAVEASKPDIEAARHAIAVELPAEPIWLEADPERLAQVVTNLLNNATRYTPPNGNLTVRVAIADSEAVLSVADTGVGLGPDDVGRVFEMFTQVGGPGSGGLGIGLALVRGIVELHGGQVEARSDGIGRGSEFRIRLPLRVTTSLEVEATDRQTNVASPRRVLVVDDNTDAARMMAELLELYGHTVWVAHDAVGALAAVSRETPDVALLDIGLPGMDGYQLARQLRQRADTRTVRLVAVTGWGQDSDRARAYEAGFDAHLTKPAEPDLILSVL